jgi:hypothetical protein
MTQKNKITILIVVAILLILIVAFFRYNMNQSSNLNPASEVQQTGEDVENGLGNLIEEQEVDQIEEGEDQDYRTTLQDLEDSEIQDIIGRYKIKDLSSNKFLLNIEEGFIEVNNKALITRLLVTKTLTEEDLDIDFKGAMYILDTQNKELSFLGSSITGFETFELDNQTYWVYKKAVEPELNGILVSKENFEDAKPIIIDYHYVDSFEIVENSNLEVFAANLEDENFTPLTINLAEFINQNLK